MPRGHGVRRERMKIGAIFLPKKTKTVAQLCADNDGSQNPNPCKTSPNRPLILPPPTKQNQNIANVARITNQVKRLFPSPKTKTARRDNPGRAVQWFALSD